MSTFYFDQYFVIQMLYGDLASFISYEILIFINSVDGLGFESLFLCLSV